MRIGLRLRLRLGLTLRLRLRLGPGLRLRIRLRLRLLTFEVISVSLYWGSRQSGATSPSTSSRRTAVLPG